MGPIFQDTDEDINACDDVPDIKICHKEGERIWPGKLLLSEIGGEYND